MVRLFIDDSDSALDPAAMLRPAASLWWKALSSVPRIAGMTLQAAAAKSLRGASGSAWDTLERIARALPAGVLDANAAELTLRQLFATEHGSDDFRRLPSRLRIVATDIDTGQPVEFGAPGFDDVPISRAVIASSAVPGIFAPVRIGGRYFVDGALNRPCTHRWP
jgi:predicted acylesterase/phospholipase RssA